MPIAALAGPLIGLAGSAIGGLFGSKGATKAANTQADATKYAADLSKSAADNSLAFAKDQSAQSQKNFAPYLQSGSTALDSLSAGFAPGGQFTKTFDQTAPQFNAPGAFVAPTGVDEANDPGYQFRLAESQKAISRASMAHGGAFTGGTLKALSRDASDYASGEFQNTYNRAKSTYDTNYNSQADAYTRNLSGLGLNENIFNTNRSGQLNPLLALSGMGQSAASSLAQGSQYLTNTNTNTLTHSADQQGDYALQGANAKASGTVANTNILTQLLGGLTGGFGGSGGLLAKLLSGLGGGGSFASTDNGGIPSNGYYDIGGGYKNPTGLNSGAVQIPPAWMALPAR